MAEIGFIIGAGASVDYGLPTGAQLRNNIIESTSSVDEIKQYSFEDFDEQRYNNFCRKFQESGISSIDKFLNTNPHFIYEGKIAITLLIKKIELQCITNIYVNSDTNWILYLYNRMTANISTPDNIDELKDHGFYFCTFNYDRILDFALSNFIYNSFSEVSDVKNIMAENGHQGLLDSFNIDIDHVYGQIGSLSENLINQDIKKSSPNRYFNQIKLINERAIDIKPIFDKLFTCERIYLLGYGFNEENNRLLMFNKLFPKIKSYATGIGLMPEECERIRTNYPVNFEPLKSMDLLRKRLG